MLSGPDALQPGLADAEVPAVAGVRPRSLLGVNYFDEREPSQIGEMAAMPRELRPQPEACLAARPRGRELGRQARSTDRLVCWK